MSALDYPEDDAIKDQERSGPVPRPTSSQDGLTPRTPASMAKRLARGWEEFLCQPETVPVWTPRRRESCAVVRLLHSRAVAMRSPSEVVFLVSLMGNTVPFASQNSKYVVFGEF